MAGAMEKVNRSRVLKNMNRGEKGMSKNNTSFKPPPFRFGKVSYNDANALSVAKRGSLASVKDSGSQTSLCSKSLKNGSTNSLEATEIGHTSVTHARIGRYGVSKTCSGLDTDEKTLKEDHKLSITNGVNKHNSYLDSNEENRLENEAKLPLNEARLGHHGPSIHVAPSIDSHAAEKGTPGSSIVTKPFANKGDVEIVRRGEGFKKNCSSVEEISNIGLLNDAERCENEVKPYENKAEIYENGARGILSVPSYQHKSEQRTALGLDNTDKRDVRARKLGNLMNEEMSLGRSVAGPIKINVKPTKEAIRSSKCDGTPASEKRKTEKTTTTSLVKQKSKRVPTRHIKYVSELDQKIRDKYRRKTESTVASKEKVAKTATEAQNNVRNLRGNKTTSSTSDKGGLADEQRQRNKLSEISNKIGVPKFVGVSKSTAVNVSKSVKSTGVKQTSTSKPVSKNTASYLAPTSKSLSGKAESYLVRNGLITRGTAKPENAKSAKITRKKSVKVKVAISRGKSLRKPKVVNVEKRTMKEIKSDKKISATVKSWQFPFGNQKVCNEKLELQFSPFEPLSLVSVHIRSYRLVIALGVY